MEIGPIKIGAAVVAAIIGTFAIGIGAYLLVDARRISRRLRVARPFPTGPSTERRFRSAPARAWPTSRDQP